LFLSGGGRTTSFSHYDEAQQEQEDDEVDLGTTIVAIKYRGGVVIGADTRTSVSDYVSNRFAQKLVKLLGGGGGGVIMGRSGSAADTQRLAYLAECEMARRSYRYFGLSTTISTAMQVSSVARWLSGVLYGGGGGGGGSGEILRASLIVVGYDPSCNHAKVYAVAPTGAVWEEPLYAATGSGSTVVMGFLDHRLRACVGATTTTTSATDNTSVTLLEEEEEEAIRICRQAIELAIQWDGSSGGVAQLCVCDAAGVRDVVTVDAKSQSSSSSSSATFSNADAGPKRLDGFAMPSRIS
jgi:20S proteasome subunit beta 1